MSLVAPALLGMAVGVASGLILPSCARAELRRKLLGCLMAALALGGLWFWCWLAYVTDAGASTAEAMPVPKHWYSIPMFATAVLQVLGSAAAAFHFLTEETRQPTERKDE